MAELVGSAEIRVDMSTQAAVRSLRQMVARTDGPLRALKRRVSEVRRELAGLRGASVAVTVDDRTRAGVTSVRAAVRDLERLGPVQIRATVDAQPAEIVRAARAMRDLRNDADGTARSLAVLSLRANSATGELRRLATAARTADRALSGLRTKALSAAATLAALSGQARRLRNELDDMGGTARRAGDGLGGLRGRIGSVGTAAGQASGGAGSMTAALIGLASAAIPVAASAASVAASVGAATVALGVFGGAVAGQVKSLVELAEAQKEAETAAANHGVASTEAAQAQDAYRAALDALPPATRRAAIAFDLLTDEYQAWSDALAKDTMPVVTKSMAVFGALLPRLTPVVRRTSTELDRLMSVLGGAVQSNAVGRLSNQFAEFASGAISRATTALAGFTQTADTGAVGQGYREFMAFVQATGPLVAETLGNVTLAAVRLLNGLSDLGVTVLGAVNALAKLVNALPASFISLLVQMYAALKLVRLGLAGVAAAGASGAMVAAVTNLRLLGRAARRGRLAATLAHVARNMSLLQKAAIGLGVLAVAAVGIKELAERARGAPPDVDRLTTSLKQLGEAGVFRGELRKTFGDIDGLVEKMKQLGQATKDQEEFVKSFSDSGVVEFLDDFRRGANDLWQDLTRGEESRSALKEDFEGLDQALAGLATSGHADTAVNIFKQLKTEALAQGRSLKEVNKLFPEYRGAVAALKAEQQLVAASMGLFGDQAVKTGAKLKEQKASADGLRQAIVALNETQRSALGGMIGFEASIDAAAKAAKENAKSLEVVNGQLDLNSPKAQAAATALNNLGQKTDEAATAARANGQSWSAVNAIYDRGRQKLIQNAMQMGLNRKEAKALANQILKTPDKTARLKGNMEDLQRKVNKATSEIKNVPQPKRSKFRGTISDLEQKIAKAKRRIRSVPKSKRSELRATIAQLERQVRRAKRSIASVRGKTVGIGVRVTGNAQLARTMALLEGRAQGGPIGYAGGGKIQGYPHGGRIRGRGTGTSDSNLILASRGEFMMREAAVRRYGAPLFEALNAMQVPTVRTRAHTPDLSRSVGTTTARRAGRQGATVTNHVTVKVENRGVIGSQAEIRNWLTASLDDLQRTGRLTRIVERATR